MFRNADASRSLEGRPRRKKERSASTLVLLILLVLPLEANNFKPFGAAAETQNTAEVRGITREIADTLPLILYSLSTYYLEDPDLKKLCISAIKHLAQKIPGLTVKLKTDELSVLWQKKNIFTKTELPRPHDYKDWAVELVTMIERLEEEGALARLKSDEILTQLIKGLTQPLDKMTKYLPPPSATGQRAAANKKRKPDLAIKTAHYKDIFYLKIPYFDPKSFPKIVQKLKEANQKYTGVILDLRENFGGDLIEAVDITDAFLGKGLIATSQGRHPLSFQKFYADTQDYINAKKMVVLVNKNSASASELLAASLKDAKRAVIIGSTTYGKGTIQCVEELPSGGSLVMTWAELSSPQSGTWNKKGVKPHIDTRNAQAFLARFKDIETPQDVDLDMRIAYVLLKAPGIYAETLSSF